MLSTPTTNQEHHELDTMDSDYRQARDHPEGERLLLSQGDEAVAAGKGTYALSRLSDIYLIAI